MLPWHPNCSKNKKLKRPGQFDYINIFIINHDINVYCDSDGRPFYMEFYGYDGFLIVGFLLGMISLFAPKGTVLQALGGVFVHLGLGHILGNLMLMTVIGLGLSTFAHPVEFGGILLSATVVHAVMSYFFFPVVGLSLVVYAMVAALIVYLCGVVFELDHFGTIGKVALPVTGVLLLTVVLVLVSDQLLHDLAVVFEGQAVQFDDPIYTRGEQFCPRYRLHMGGVAAVGLRYVRYRIFEIP
jgi:membrane associated rhomboid family serine protease